MASSEITTNPHYLSNVYDEYNSWQTAQEQTVNTLDTNLDPWQPFEWFSTSSDCDIQEGSSPDINELLEIYHPHLPPISVAFPAYSPNSKKEEPLRELTNLQLECMSDWSTPNKECDLGYYNVPEKQDTTRLDAEILDSSVSLSDGNPEVVEQPVLPCIIISNPQCSSVNDEKQVTSDLLIHTLPNYKRQKTVRELLQEREQHVLIHRLPDSPEEGNYDSTPPSFNIISPSQEAGLLVSSEATNTTVRKNLNTVLNDDEVPKFKKGRVNAKEHKPRHYEIKELIIGNFVIRNEEPEKKSLNRLKILFSKRKFVYEFEVNFENQESKVACINVPFRTVTAIKCSGSSVMLKVDSQPYIYLGSRQRGFGIIAATNVYDKSQYVDITEGEIQKCPVHKMLLRRYKADQMKLYLWHFDARFKILTQLDFTEEVSPNLMMLPAPELEPQLVQKRSCKKGLIQPSFLLNSGEVEISVLLTSSVCACQKSCKSMKCSCAKLTRKCNSGRSVCLCYNCDNPLNIMENMGIDLETASRDICLIQNVYQLTNLSGYLMQKLQLHCCNSMCLVKDCIPGMVRCPNFKCPTQVQYSWCDGIATDENEPRNHCRFCGKCSFLQKRHCLVCKKCYDINANSDSCPNCSIPTNF